MTVTKNWKNGIFNVIIKAISSSKSKDMFMLKYGKNSLISKKFCIKNVIYS